MATSSFTADLKKYAKKVDRTLEQTYKGVTFHLFSAVIMDTPVLDGFLRGSWYSKENTPVFNATPRKDPAGSIAATEMSAMVGSAKLGGKMTMTNSMPYAHRVEYEGWSRWKAPAGMVRINFARVSSILRQAVREAKK